MLHEIDVLYLLKESADNYISSLNGRGFDWTEYEGQINAYLKVLDDKELNYKYKYIDIDRAKVLIGDVEIRINDIRSKL